jgi:hypothetical protein
VGVGVGVGDISGLIGMFGLCGDPSGADLVDDAFQVNRSEPVEKQPGVKETSSKNRKIFFIIIFDILNLTLIKASLMPKKRGK